MLQVPFCLRKPRQEGQGDVEAHRLGKLKNFMGSEA